MGASVPCPPRPWLGTLGAQASLFPVIAVGVTERLAPSMERRMLFRPAPGLSIFHYSLLCLLSSLDSPTEWGLLNDIQQQRRACPKSSPTAGLGARLSSPPVGRQKEAGPGWPMPKVLTQSAIVWGWSVGDK